MISLINHIKHEWLSSSFRTDRSSCCWCPFISAFYFNERTYSFFYLFICVIQGQIFSMRHIMPSTDLPKCWNQLTTIQCSAGKPWVLAIFFFFLWIPLGTHHLTVQVHPSWHWHSPIAITPAARMMHPAMSQMLRNGPKNMTKSSRRLHGLLIPPDHKPVDHPWVVPGLCDSWRPYITTHRAQRIRQKTLQSWWSLIHGGASMYRTCCHEGVYSVYVI